jgi:hypothetical protein
MASLPGLSKDTLAAVHELMKDKRFLSWNFNVFELETKSNGHSLWFAAMTVFSHYNFGGVSVR